MVAFSPRAKEISLYMSQDPAEKEKLLKGFGKHKTGGGRIYIKTLKDIDIEVLGKLIAASIKHLQKKYPS